MSIDWFRSWHGAPTDPKWLLIAKLAMKRSETQCNAISPGMVSAVVWALFDHASQHAERGRVDDFDAETYASYSGFDEANVAAIIASLNDKSLIVSGLLSAWQKRQPKREDHSTERVREHRNAVKRSETQGNARVDKEKSREDKKEREGAFAPPAEKQSRKKSRLPMPDIFPMTDRHRAYAAERGFVGVRADQLFAAFKNHHGANGSAFANWDMAWNKWVDNEIKFNSERTGRSSVQGPKI